MTGPKPFIYCLGSMLNTSCTVISNHYFPSVDGPVSQNFEDGKQQHYTMAIGGSHKMWTV